MDEVRRTIDRWYFWVSVTGIIFVEPKRRILSMKDLADMVHRLRIVCDRSFPGLIAFDFSRCSFRAQQWKRVLQLVQELASGIKAKMLSHRNRRKTLASVVLYRCAPRSDSKSPNSTRPATLRRPS